MSAVDKTKLKGAIESIEHLKASQKRTDQNLSKIKIDEFRTRLDEAEQQLALKCVKSETGAKLVEFMETIKMLNKTI